MMKSQKRRNENTVLTAALPHVSFWGGLIPAIVPQVAIERFRK